MLTSVHQTHPNLSGATLWGSLGSRSVFDSSSKLGSSICKTAEPILNYIKSNKYNYKPSLYTNFQITFFFNLCVDLNRMAALCLL